MLSKDEYLNNVSKEIKFKAARNYLRRELEEHIDDKAREFSKKGVPDAEAAAVAAMGDAKETGRALNAVHRPRTEWGVIVCMLLLSLGGTAAVFAGQGHIFIDYSQTFWSGLQSILPVFLTLGLCLMVGLYFFDYTRLLRLRHVLFILTFLLIAGSIITALALRPSYSNGSVWLSTFEAWNTIIDLLFSILVLISPLFLMLSAAGYIQRNKDNGIRGTVCVSLVCGVCVFAVYTLSGSTVYPLLLAIVCIAMMLVSASNSIRRKKWLHFAIASVAVVIVFVFCLFLVPSQGGAIMVTGSDGASYSIAPTYTCAQSMHEILKDAKIVGASPQLIQNPEWRLNTSQYVITFIIVEYGWLAGIGIVLAFIALLVFMTGRSLKIADPFGRLLAFGITAIFFVRFALFILTSTGLIGELSVNLPFVNCCNYYYITDALLIGIFLSVWRRSAFIKDSSCFYPSKPRTDNTEKELA